MRTYLALSALGACLLALAPGTTAYAGSSTYYAGKNSEGQKLLFSVDQTAKGPAFDPFFTNMIDRCPATGTKITIQFSFQGFEIPIKNGKFNLALNDISDRFDWRGTITPKNATGQESFQMAAFDNQGGLQDCATGSVAWTAQALVAGSRPAAAPVASHVVKVKVSKAADGSVRFSVTR